MSLLLIFVLQSADHELAKEALGKPTPELRAKLKARTAESPLAAAWWAAIARPEDAKLFKKYVESLPPEFNADAHAKVIGDLSQDPSELAALLSLAHFCALVKMNADPNAVAVIGARLKLVKIEGKWATNDGALIQELRKSFDTGTMGPEKLPNAGWPALYVKAYVLMKAAVRNSDLIETAVKHLSSIKSGAPSHIEALLSKIKDSGPCRRCKGQGKKPCDQCKEIGERVATCSQCQGAGQLLKGVSGRTGKEIIEPCSMCKGKGKWAVDCPTCEAGQIVCTACKGAEFKAPTLDDWASVSPCKVCGGSGNMFAEVIHPCAFCKGLGFFLKPKSAESKLVGPQE